MSTAARLMRSLVVLVLVMGFITLALWLALEGNRSYDEHVAVAKAVLSGGVVEIKELDNIRDMIQFDSNFTTALRKAGVSDEDIRRLVGQEFKYFKR